MIHAKINNEYVYVDNIFVGLYTNKIIKNELQIFKINKYAPTFCESVVVDFCAYVKLLNGFI